MASLDDGGRQHFVYFNLLLPLAPGGHVLVNDGIVLYEGEGQGLLLQAGGRAGGRGLEAVPAFEGGESDPGYVVVAGDEGQSVSRDSAVAPGSAGGGGRGEGGGGGGRTDYGSSLSHSGISCPVSTTRPGPGGGLSSSSLASHH